MEISTKKAILSYTIGIMFVLLILHRTHHPLFAYLISSSPEIICTVILLATLQRYGGRRKNDEEGKRAVEGESDNKAKVQRDRNYYFDKDEHAMKLDGDDQRKEVRSLMSDRDRKTKSQEKSSNNDEDGERNVMELRVCEVGRFQRLESLIEKRRLRKLQRYETEKNLIDIDSYYHMALIPSISAPRRSLFYSDGNYNNSSPMPNSAPSFLQPRANPFDLPIEPKYAVSTLSNEYLSHHDFVPAATKRSTSICMRQTDLGETNQEKPESEKLDSEEAKRLAYRRQLSRRSKSKLRYNKILYPTNTVTAHIEQGPQIDSADNQINENRTETDNNVSTPISIKETHQAANVSGATLKEEFIQVQKLHASDTQIPEANIEEGYSQDSNKKDSSLNVLEDSTTSVAVLKDEPAELQRVDDSQVADPVSSDTQNPEAIIEEGYNQDSNENDPSLNVVEDSTTSMAIQKDESTVLERVDDAQVAYPVSNSYTRNTEANIEEGYNQDSNKNKNDSCLTVVEDSTTSMAIPKDESTESERVDDAQVADPVSSITQKPEAINEEGYNQDSNEKESSVNVDDDPTTTSMAIPKDESTEFQRDGDDQVAHPVHSDTQTPETNTEEIYNQDSYEKDDSSLNVHEDPSISVAIPEDEWVGGGRED